MTSSQLRVSDLDVDLEAALNIPIHPDKIVLAEAHEDFPGCLHFDLADPDTRQEFFTTYKKWMSRHLVLNELFQLQQFVDKINEDGWHILFDPSAAPMLEDYHRWSNPLIIDGYNLYEYQNFTLAKALERQQAGSDNEGRFFFWNWSAGAGKSYCVGAGIKALGDSIDLVIAATTSDLKINLFRFLRDGGVDVAITDGGPTKREQIYAENHRCLVMNFEKFRVDFDELSALVKGKRVLFVLDEAQKLIAEAGQNQSRAALDKLTRSCEATIWPMTATAVGASPLRYRDVFALDGHPRKNVLGTKEAFVAKYARKVESKVAKARSGAVFPIVNYTWDTAKLQEIRHRVHDRMTAVRRASNMPTIVLRVQASDGQRQAFDVIVEKARRDVIGKGLDPGPFYRLLRQVAVTPAALKVTEDQLAQEINAEYPDLAEASAPKIDMLNEMLDVVADQGDQAVCFVHWTTGGLHMISPKVRARHVKHWGTGQTRKQSQKAVDDFKAMKGITAFLSSDAGALGLSFQNARYVINIDPVYDYDLMTQRNKRIDRADSYLEGLTSYVMITEDSVEERVWRVCNARRKVSAATQGTVEELTPEEQELGTLPEYELMNWMLFG